MRRLCSVSTLQAEMIATHRRRTSHELGISYLLGYRRSTTHGPRGAYFPTQDRQRGVRVMQVRLRCAILPDHR